MEKRFRLDKRHFSVLYQGHSTSALINGSYYFGYINDKGGLVVLNEERKWSKYGVKNFKQYPGVLTTVVHVYGSLAIKGSDVTTCTDSGLINLKTPSIGSTSKEIADMLGMDASVVESILSGSFPSSSSTITGSFYAGGGGGIIGASTTPSKATVMPHTFSNATYVADTIAPVVKKESVKMTTYPKKNTLSHFLNEQGVSDTLIKKIQEFRNENKLDSGEASLLERINKPNSWYVGKEWSLAISAILAGKNILLEGDKATGKNVFAECLAYLFGRPIWDISCHTNTNAESLIGGETFRDGQVEFRPGSVYNVAKFGGFGVLDEINMAKADALAVLHSITDRRRVLDVPGYQRLNLNQATRFIGTMNSGYAGTRELNEALVSRFVVIHVTSMPKASLLKHLQAMYPSANASTLGYFAQLFCDLQAKAKSSEISTKSVDLRGIQDAIEIVEVGNVSPYEAVEVCIINKAFDEYEKTLVRDVVNTLIPKSWTSLDLFSLPGSISVTF